MILMRGFAVHEVDRIMFRERRLVKISERQPILIKKYMLAGSNIKFL